MVAPERLPREKCQSEGQWLLNAIPDSHATVAAAVGCSKMLVSYWRNGARLPAAELREAIRARYGIDPRAWDRLPARLVSEPPPDEDEDEEQERVQAPVLGRHGMTLDEVNELLDQIRQRRRDQALDARSFVQLATVESRLIAQRVKLLEGDRVDESEFVRGPRWVQFRTRLVEALKGVPGALDVLLVALREAEQ